MAISIVRKSGNSTVLVLPPEFVRERKLRIGETVEFEVFKKTDLSKLWGISRHLKIDAQKAKNELRKEW
ncbi:hypothetical protein HYU09_00910 [Candidatus Woesearchaeota archaeon]|nr:hypothetical protein [Candidatus Woesearchaeota archaeon]